VPIFGPSPSKDECGSFVFGVCRATLGSGIINEGCHTVAVTALHKLLRRCCARDRVQFSFFLTLLSSPSCCASFLQGQLSGI
jgi:hypothetical protein